MNGLMRYILILMAVVVILGVLLPFLWIPLLVLAGIALISGLKTRHLVSDSRDFAKKNVIDAEYEVKKEEDDR